MVLAAPDRSEVTDALIAVLAADTGKQIGDHEAPGESDDPPTEPTLPYAIVYHITHGPTVASSEAPTMPDREQLHIYQVTCIGETREQADWLSHKCRRAITDRTINPNGWRLQIGSTNTLVIDRHNNVSVSPGREGALWRGSDRYQLMVTSRGPDAVF